MGDGALTLAVVVAVGFVFAYDNNYTGYRIRHFETQPIIFLSTASALVLLLAARILLLCARHLLPAVYDSGRRMWLELVPSAGPWLGTAIVMFALAVLLNRAINLLWTSDAANASAIEANGSELEKLMLAALRRKLPIAVTLKSRKVYVGRVGHLPNLAEGKRGADISLLPILSGYRDETDFSYRFTTYYAHILGKVVAGADGFAGRDLHDFLVVIPVTEIVTAHMFDQSIYVKHGDLFRHGG